MDESHLVIDVKDVSKSFHGRLVVDRLGMQVRRREIYGFLGPNGSGKTTFLRMLCGLLTPDSGEGQCLGYDFRRQFAEIRNRVGYMTQKFSLYEDLTIEENLDFIARLYGVPARRTAVTESLERLKLTERRRQLAGQLSGGWKQRLALAACLIQKPDLLLLDEPTAGVDPKARRDFWDELHRLASQGLTVLITTHYMDEAERCHRLAYIAYGQLLARGTAAEVVRASGLSTLAVTGPDLPQLEARLRDDHAVDLVAAFGSALHACGRDRPALERAVGSALTADHAMQPIETSLEDVFISLMREGVNHLH
jgi:ABC-2 type transport system ATP-binding protein